MASVGDKYIIEIDKVLDNGMCRIKEFNGLAFTENVLIKLERYDPKAEDELKVGDEVIKDGVRWVVIATDDKRIVMLESSGNVQIYYVCQAWAKKNYHKTGRHFSEIEDLLLKLKTVPHNKDDERYSLVGCQYCKHCNLGGDEFPCSDCYHGNGCDDASYFERRE